MRFCSALLLVGLASMSFAGEAKESTPPKAGDGSAKTAAPEPYLGVGIDATIFDPNSGLTVDKVVPGSTAADMDIRIGDHLLTFNGKKLGSQAELKEQLTGQKVGDQIEITVSRDGETAPLTLTGKLSPKISSKSVWEGLDEARKRLNDMNNKLAQQKPKHLSLPEILDRLKDIEVALPGALEEFKKLYPNGRLAFSLHIDITNDKDAKNPATVSNRVESPAPAPAPKATK